MGGYRAIIVGTHTLWSAVALTLIDRLGHLQARRARERVAPEGRGVVSRAEDVAVALAEHGADRHT